LAYGLGACVHFPWKGKLASLVDYKDYIIV